MKEQEKALIPGAFSRFSEKDIFYERKLLLDG